MNIKKYGLGLLGAVLLMGQPSCNNVKNSEVFDESVDQRYERVRHDISELLTASKNGWILEYIPNKEAEYGGFNIGLKFDKDGNVLINSEIQELEDLDDAELLAPGIKSSYRVGKDAGTTINFDTYNEALHFFATPDRPRPHGKGFGRGYEGDYEFVVQSYADGEVIVVGKKTNVKMRFFVPKVDMREYLKQVIRTKRKVFSPESLKARVEDGILGQDIFGKHGEMFYTLSGDISRVWKGVKKELELDDLADIYTVPYFYMPEGVKFFDLKTGQSYLYKWDEETQTLALGDKKLKARPDPYYEDYMSFAGDYQMKTANGGDLAVTLEPSGRNLYTLKGLPYPVQFSYDVKTKRFGFSVPQILPNGQALIAALNEARTTLSWAQGIGAYAERLVDASGTPLQPEQYRFVDNGVWGGERVGGWILWVPGKGIYQDLKPNLIYKPIFIRK